MLRGEFIRADGLVIPNNVTIFGAQTILELALRNSAETFYLGLCSADYTPDLTIADDGFVEPTIGVNGYGRKALTRDNNADTGWPNAGAVNDNRYLESGLQTFTAVGGPFDQPITRMFLALHQTSLVASVFALSGTLPDELTIDVDTDESDRQFRYRLYMR